MTAVVTLEEVRVTGLSAVELATTLLQRARLASDDAGLWEAADVQWWWRTARRSDELEQLFWTDADGPVGGVLATEFRGTWQCDALLVQGAIAGYSLYWSDPVTKVGLLEPMRVNDEFQRRGIARAMLTAGLERLARRGATRFKVGYSTVIAGALYTGSGFRPTTTATWYRAGEGAAA